MERMAAAAGAGRSARPGARARVPRGAAAGGQDVDSAVVEFDFSGLL